MASKLDKYVLKNGMVLLGEPMDWVGSAAFGFMLPCGTANLPDNCGGASSVITDWLFRGAGGKTNRQLGDALDSLGLHRNSSVGSRHLSFIAALEAANLLKALELYADVILKPALEDDQFELSRQLILQELLSLEDDPRQKVMLRLIEEFYPDPLGRNPLGSVEQLQALTVAKTEEIIRQNFDLSQAIFSVAGKYDFAAVCEKLEQLFDIEQKPLKKAIKIGVRKPKYVHEPHDGAQVHIGLMTPTVSIVDEDYYNAIAAVNILAGSMSSRLFTEVREKRGLCYAVGAKYHTLKECAGIACYSGTTPEKSQETLDIIISEFNRLCEGVTQDEILRAKTGLKSSLIMQSESSSSRAGGIAADYYFLGRVRSLEEIRTKVEQLSAESVLNFLRSHKFRDFTVVTIGPQKLAVKD